MSLALEPASVDEQRRLVRRRFSRFYGLYVFGALMLFAFNAFITPGESLIALTMMALSLVWILIQPKVGIYLIVAFTLVGDSSTTPWYPFSKGFSSYESVLYVSDQIVLNPLEVFLLATTGSWLLTSIGNPEWRFRRGALLVPLVIFGMFVLAGLVYGYSRQGSTHVALWEARPLAYLPLFYVLVTNLLRTTKEYRRLIWVAMIAITVQSLLSLQWYASLDQLERENLESLTEHSAAVHFNALIILLLAVMTLRGCSPSFRIALPLMAVPVVWAHLIGERRSAVIGFALAVILFSVLLFRLNRRGFWWFVPAVAIGSAFYLGAFWSVQGPLGFPAQAIKTVIAPDELSAVDQSSAIYRELEARNVWFTMRNDPLTGIGFGRPFTQIYPLPDISFFPFWRYMPHHSFLWIWLKMGFLGFVTMLFVMARTIQYGVRSVLRAPQGDTQAITVTALLYVVMYLVFAYVDIAWDIRSMVFLAVSMAICADLVPESAPERPRGAAEANVPEHTLA